MSRFLVVDLDFGAPGLDPFFNPDWLASCRGLRGLVVEFERRPRRKRPLWLRGALIFPNWLGSCRGLRGPGVEFERRPRRKRPPWLRGALIFPEYVQRPLEEVPYLVFLPSCLSPDQAALSETERAEALTLLRAEIGFAEGRATAIPVPSHWGS